MQLAWIPLLEAVPVLPFRAVYSENVVSLWLVLNQKHARLKIWGSADTTCAVQFEPLSEMKIGGEGGSAARDNWECKEILSDSLDVCTCW